MASSFARQTLELHGVYPDLIPQDAPATGWNECNNVYFKDGMTHRVPGDTPVYGAPTVKALAMVFYTNASGEHFWVYATLAGYFGYDGTTHHNLTGASVPAAESIITLISFNGMVVANDSLAGPSYWSGSIVANFATLPNWPAGWRCLSMRMHKAFLFAIGRHDTSGYQRVNWSDAAEAGTLPASWTPAADNLAGFQDLLPMSSPCIDGFTIRDEFLVFKGETVSSFVFVGGSAVFAIRDRFKGVGLAGVGGFCLGPNDQALFFGSEGDIYRTDGVGYASILDGIAQRTYYEASDPAQLRRVHAATLSRYGLSILAWPGNGETVADRSIIFSWSTGEISFRDLPRVTCLGEGRYLDGGIGAKNTWDGAVGNWNSDAQPWNHSLSPATQDDVIAGSETGFYWLTGETEATVPLWAYALKQGLGFGKPQARKLIGRVWPKFIGTPGDVVDIRVGGQETAGGDVTWVDSVAHVVGSGLPVDVLAAGRFMALEVSAGGGSGWRLGSVDVEYREQGGW